MDGFDLDGTLADVNFQQAAVRGMAAIFTGVPVIYTPDKPFVVITGRPHSTGEQTRATTRWLTEHQPNFKAIYYVEGSEAQMIEQKASIINRLRLATFTDNNPDVLTALSKLTRAQLFILENGQRVRF